MISTGAAAPAAAFPPGHEFRCGVGPGHDEGQRAELVELVRIAQDDLRRVELQIRRGAADESDRESAMEQLRFVRAQLQCMDEEISADDTASREAAQREAQRQEQAKAEALGEAAGKLMALAHELGTWAGELRNMVAEFHAQRLALWNALPKEARSSAAVSVAFDDGTWRGILENMAESITGNAAGNYVAAEADRRFARYLAASEIEQSRPPLT